MKVAIHTSLRDGGERGSEFRGGTWEELSSLVEEHLGEARPGYRDGVLLVRVPPEGFVSAVALLDATVCLEVEFAPRFPGEAAVLQAFVVGARVPAALVDVVLYRHDVLAEGGEASSDAEWEVVTILAWPDQVEGPMAPTTMARNSLGLKGGTKGEFSAEQFAQSIWYWATHALIRPPKKE